MSFIHFVYPLLQTVNRLALHRGYWRESRLQKQMRRTKSRLLEEYSHSKAVAYANQMAEVSPAYSCRLKEVKITLPIDNSLESWQRLPKLNKADYQSDPESWINSQMDPQSMQWSCTSGSSGEPFRFPQDNATLLAENVSNELFLKALGWKPEYKVATFKMEFPKIKGWRLALRKVMRNSSINFSAVKFRSEHTLDVIEKLRREKVQYLRGYSSAIMLLAEEARRLQISCYIPLITTFGEGLTDRQATVIEEVFRGKVYRDYGGSEAMHIGYECPARTGYHIDLSRFHVEILNGERPVRPGETGEIVVTCFRNSAMPFVRYRMGDLGILVDPREPCPCGCTYPQIKTIKGRINDTISIPGGENVNLLFFVYVFEFAHAHITKFRIIQKENDLLEIHWVPRHPRAHEHLQDLEQKIIERTGGKMRVEWRAVNEILPEPSGKHRILVPFELA